MMQHIGKQTVAISSPVYVAETASIVGKKEGEGPMRDCFDQISEDSYFGQKSWEKAESTMLRACFDLVLQKAKLPATDLQFILSGDLQSQCTGSGFAMRDAPVPFLGLYGACSTMGEAMSVGAMLIAGGAADTLCAMASSHFSSAERQFRGPLEYGNQRTPTAQWTVTAAGAAILKSSGGGPRITNVTTGIIEDAGVVDPNNMGAAMAPAALSTIKAHFEDTGRSPDYYDAVITGDLGYFGHDIFADLAHREGMEFPNVFTDCGILMFNRKTQDTHAGGSGCGCSASIFAGHIFRCMKRKLWNRVLFAPTGALLSIVSAQQGESIPGICHAVALENEEVKS